jgi:hypothetical protein
VSASYPFVTNEYASLHHVVHGRSLARYGDGEFALCAGRSIPCQRGDAGLQARLRDILRESGDCLVGIPNLHSDTPKTAYWHKYQAASRYLTPRLYLSAFITRPDSAPWIDTPAYWALLESLWIGQDVTLVRGSARSLTKDDLVGAGRVTEILAPRQDAWANYPALLEQIGTPSRVLLCLGPTATVLAVDLCAKGVHAIDLGHVGLWLKKHRRGEPMVRTEADKVTT